MMLDILDQNKNSGKNGNAARFLTLARSAITTSMPAEKFSARTRPSRIGNKFRQHSGNKFRQHSGNKFRQHSGKSGNVECRVPSSHYTVQRHISSLLSPPTGIDCKKRQRLRQYVWRYVRSRRPPHNPFSPHTGEERPRERRNGRQPLAEE